MKKLVDSKYDVLKEAEEIARNKEIVKEIDDELMDRFQELMKEGIDWDTVIEMFPFIKEESEKTQAVLKEQIEKRNPDFMILVVILETQKMFAREIVNAIQGVKWSEMFRRE